MPETKAGNMQPVASHANDERIHDPVTKDGMLSILAANLGDLARQNTTEFRARYYGDCKGILKTLIMIGWLDPAEGEQWRADILSAHLQAIQQCNDDGQSVDSAVMAREQFQLEKLVERGFKPRTSLSRD